MGERSLQARAQHPGDCQIGWIPGAVIMLMLWTEGPGVESHSHRTWHTTSSNSLASPSGVPAVEDGYALGRDRLTREDAGPPG